MTGPAARSRGGETLELALGGSAVKVLCKAVQCASRIGNEILLEVVQADSLSLRSLNGARSAFFNAKFRADAFDYFRMTKPLVQVAVTTKAFLAALRTPKIQMIRMSLKGPDDNMLCFELSSEAGLQKRYSIPTLTDVEFLNTNIDKHTYNTRLSARPDVLSRLLSSFQAGPSDVTVTCRPQGGGKNLMFSSTKDSLRAGNNGDAALVTELELSAVDEEIDYHFQGQGSQSLSFNLKDFKAMVTFCGDVGTDVSVHLDDPGRPVIIASFRRPSQRAESDFTAEMTLATMEESELIADQRFSRAHHAPQTERRTQRDVRSKQPSPTPIQPQSTATQAPAPPPPPRSHPLSSVQPAEDFSPAHAHSPVSTPIPIPAAQTASHKRACEWPSDDDNDECVPATPPEQR